MKDARHNSTDPDVLLLAANLTFTEKRQSPLGARRTDAGSKAAALVQPVDKSGHDSPSAGDLRLRAALTNTAGDFIMKLS